MTMFSAYITPKSPISAADEEAARKFYLDFLGLTEIEKPDIAARARWLLATSGRQRCPHGR